jgi:phosphomannomutase
MLMLGTAGARWDSDINDNEIDFLILRFYRYICEQRNNYKYIADKIYVGFDARPQSAVLARRIKALIDIAPNDDRIHLVNGVPITTPMLCRICQEHRAYGMMFTASHNPSNYVGVKFITPDGTLFESGDVSRINGLHVGLDVEYHPVMEFYRLFDLVKFKNKEYSFSTLGGAARGYIRDIFQGGIEEDNTPALGNSLEPRENNVVLPRQNGITFALDGDGDRLLVFIDGQALTPSETFMLFVKASMKYRALSHAIAAYNMSNTIEQYCTENYISFEWSKIGFQHITPKYKAVSGFVAAGEESGGLALHPVFSDRDGIAAAIILMEYNENYGLRHELSYIRNRFGRMRYNRYDLRNQTISDITKKIPELNSLMQNIDGEKYLFESGWMMLRESGTEPLTRIYCETYYDDNFDLKQFIDGRIS